MNPIVSAGREALHGNEQTELRALADSCLQIMLEHRSSGDYVWIDRDDLELLRRAADRIDRLTALMAFIEEWGDAL